MTGAVPSHLSPAPHSSHTRLGLALVASTLAHGVLISALVPDLRWLGVAWGPVGMPITVQLALAPDTSVIPDEEMRHMLGPTPAGNPNRSSGKQSVPDTIGAPANALVLPATPDPTYYPLREVDDYPRPLAPLRIDQPPGSFAGEIRLELLIDEHGVVREITYSGAAERGRMYEALRAALMTTLFIPAIKGGRAVRSRIVLSVVPSTASER